MSACLEIQPLPSMNQVGSIDHYTLIVECAETVAHFHADVLGFELLEVRPLNTGSAEPGCHDMLNYIMRAPDGSGRTIVITEGLTDQSFFRKHLREHGPGIHHVAYQVNSIEDAMAAMCARGAEFQSETPVTDPRSGLKQVFLKVPGAGYTIELIERGDGVESEVFQNNNMTGLVESVTDPKQAPREVVRVIAKPIDTVRDLLADLSRIGEWTGHRTIRRFSTGWREVRFNGDIEVACESRDDRVVYRWGSDDNATEFTFFLESQGYDTRVRVDLSRFDPDRAAPLSEVLEAELLLFGKLVGEVCCTSAYDAALARVDAHAHAILLR